jgi:hypothetical protein
MLKISVREAVEFILNVDEGIKCLVTSIKEIRKHDVVVNYQVTFLEDHEHRINLTRSLVEAAQTYLMEGRTNEVRKKGWGWKDHASV